MGIFPETVIEPYVGATDEQANVRVVAGRDHRVAEPPPMARRGGGPGFRHQWRLRVPPGVNPSPRRAGDAVRPVLVVEVEVPGFGDEVKLVIALAAEDIDADRQLALAPDHRPIVPAVQVEADLLCLARPEHAAEIGLRAVGGRANRDLHAAARLGHLGHVGKVRCVNVRLPCQQLVQLRSSSRQGITPPLERPLEERAVLRLNFGWNSRHRCLDHGVRKPRHQARRRGAPGGPLELGEKEPVGKAGLVVKARHVVVTAAEARELREAMPSDFQHQPVQAGERLVAIAGNRSPAG